jgi:PKD repeat protein
MAVAAVGQAGQWAPTFPWPIVAAHMTVLPDGRLLSWTSNDLDHQHHTPNVYLWNPTNPGAFTQVPNSNTDVFCAAHSFQPDGRLFIAGGHITDGAGSKDANLYTTNAANGTWGRLMQMRAGRWYPTSATMGSGDIVVAAGGEENKVVNPLPEVWDGAKFRLLSGAPLEMPFYPWLHLAPDGRIFNAGPDKTTRYLNPSGDGEWTTHGSTISGVFRDYGTAVTYEPGKVLIIGGGDPPVNSAETIDLNVGGAWKATGSMQHARRQFNASVLADGKVLVTGGTNAAGFNTESGSLLAPEMWDPATGGWTTLASMTIPRTYHSTAVLLPDARVLVAGGGRCGECSANHLDAQIFSPPYLFNTDGTPATRPTITSLSGSTTSDAVPVDRGQPFIIGTANATSATRVTLVRLPSTTHGFHMNQGFVRLTPSQVTASGVTVAVSQNANLVPAGHYILFVLNGAGVPSLGRIIQLRGTTAAPPPPAAPAAPNGLVGSAVVGPKTNLQWTDNSTSESAFRIERCQGADCATFAEIATVGPNTTVFSDVGVMAGTAYGYRVRASNSTGTSLPSNTVRVTSSSSPFQPVVNRLSGSCMGVLGASTQNLAQVTLQQCQNATHQLWTSSPAGTAGEIIVYGTKCLDGYGAEGGGTNGDRVIIHDCHGGSNQQWTRTAAGEIRNFTGAKCVELTNKATAPGTELVLWTCDGSASQKWEPPGAANQPPVASFTYSCSTLSCTFANTSTDPGGSIATSSWTFGDGGTSTATSPAHTYTAAGTYSVTLTVVDGGGASNSATQSVTVAAAPPPPPPPAKITLTVKGYKLKGVLYADLTWSGAAGTSVDIFRDGTRLLLTANDGAHTDNLNRKGGGTFKYKVCEAGSTTVCSAETSVTF